MSFGETGPASVASTGDGAFEHVVGNLLIGATGSDCERHMLDRVRNLWTLGRELNGCDGAGHSIERELREGKQPRINMEFEDDVPHALATDYTD